jgi:hypothetical protein
MPGFVHSHEDEQKWSKAKELASKYHGDAHWKVANVIFHNMKKGMDASVALAKAEEEIGKEPQEGSENGMDDGRREYRGHLIERAGGKVTPATWRVSGRDPKGRPELHSVEFGSPEEAKEYVDLRHNEMSKSMGLGFNDLFKPKKAKDITPKDLGDAMASVTQAAHNRAHASMPAPSSVPPHAQNFWGHMAAAGHHAHMKALADQVHEGHQQDDAHGGKQWSHWDRGPNYPALGEAHNRIGQAHIDEAHRIASKHPDVWQHMNHVPPHDRMLAGPMATAMHPHGEAHKEWQGQWNWMFHEPHQAAAVPYSPAPAKRITTDAAAGHVLDNAETHADSFAGENGSSGDLVPGKGHQFDSKLPQISATHQHLWGKKPSGNA